MDELKRRILNEAIVGEGDIIHVDMFLNHCMDMDLRLETGDSRYFYSGGKPPRIMRSPPLSTYAS